MGSQTPVITTISQVILRSILLKKSFVQENFANTNKAIYNDYTTAIIKLVF